MMDLPDVKKWQLLSRYDVNQAAQVLSEEDKKNAQKIAEELGVSYMVGVVEQLGSDLAAHLLDNLPVEFREQVLKALPSEQKSKLDEILSYAPGTAGSLMSKDYLSVPLGMTIGEVEEYLRKLGPDKRGKVSYIYVVDPKNLLEGVIQIRDLIFYPPNKPIKEILKSPVVQVETGMRQADVAMLLKRHSYLGLPVVNAAQQLVGVISADIVVQAVEEEAADDIAKIVGTSREEIRTHSVRTILRLRLPWLLVSIASGLLCAYISGIFQKSLESVAALFLFVPVVLGMSESTGVQGATIVVRNIVLGHVSWKALAGLFYREMAVGVLIGLICGGIVGTFAFIWRDYAALGIAISVSMISAIFVSGLIGFSLPLLFRRLKIDPAIASGPLVLAICDLQTLFLYFSISSSLLS